MGSDGERIRIKMASKARKLPQKNSKSLPKGLAHLAQGNEPCKMVAVLVPELSLAANGDPFSILSVFLLLNQELQDILSMTEVKTYIAVSLH